MTTVPLDLDAQNDLGALEIWLTSTNQANETVAATLCPGETVIVGSGDGVGLRLADPTVSREHARLHHLGSGVLLEDLASRNGVVIDGARVRSCVIAPSSRALLGHAILELRRSLGAPCSSGAQARHAAPRASATQLSSKPSVAAPLPGVVGSSPAMQRLAERVRRFAPLVHPVSIRGETGTGKELVAKAIHAESGRRGAFVAINAATIAQNLAESELFGHLRGAFTGALQDRKGAFRAAHEGTLFIDEVAQLSLDVQAKLLRVLEERTVRPVGEDTETRVDVRVLTATCEPLESLVAQGKFRPDVYERLAACVVVVPPLRERLDDLGAIAMRLIAQQGEDPRRLTSSALRQLAKHRFPGNVRELRNLLLHAMVAAGPSVPITASHVLEALADRAALTPRVDREVALATVAEHRGNISSASRVLGLPRSTLRDLLARGQNAPTRPMP